MKFLIAEDELTSRLLLQNMLNRYGKCHLATNGLDAVKAVRDALEAGEPYDLICLDIEMPQMDGHTALKEIRAAEESHGITSDNAATVVMTTVSEKTQDVTMAYDRLCDGYLVKPIAKVDLMVYLQTAGLFT